MSIYYVLPALSERIFGFSEWAFRLPSLLAMAIAVFFVGRLAGRLVCPNASWFAVFSCLALRGFDYQAADARPYALGTCIVCAAMWLLVRWLDSGRWRHAALFAILAAAIIHIHFIFWPIYLAMAIVVAIRLRESGPPLSRSQMLLVFCVVTGSILTALPDSITLLRQAGAHVVAPMPSLADLTGQLKLSFVMGAGCGAAIISRIKRWQPEEDAAVAFGMPLAWWAAAPLGLFAFSWMTGHSAFVERYLFIGLPGAALMATSLAGLFLPHSAWRPITVALAAGVLLFLGGWNRVKPVHHNSDWRAAAQALSRQLPRSDTPVFCPSPFIEARPPAWRPDYPIASFLYSHLLVYPVPGHIYPLPFERSADAEDRVQAFSQQILARAPAFAVYGSSKAVASWREWLSGRLEAREWREQRLGNFGDVDVILFRNPARERELTATGDGVKERPHTPLSATTVTSSAREGPLWRFTASTTACARSAALQPAFSRSTAARRSSPNSSP
jgi:hypothetical protein